MTLRFGEAVKTAVAFDETGEGFEGVLRTSVSVEEREVVEPREVLPLGVEMARVDAGAGTLEIV